MAPAPLKVLFVASEVAPFAKAGGLGDVIGALPKALQRCGHDVRVVMPLYQEVPRHGLRPMMGPLGVPLGRERWCAVHEGRLPGSEVPVMFLEYEEYFGRPGIYSDYGDGAHRYALLSRGALQLCRAMRWIPDVVHCNDWQTSLLPAYLNSVERHSELGGVATLLTIHNLAYQGMFDARIAPELALPWGYLQNGDYSHDGALNLLKGGLYHATLINAVSPTYAREIQTSQLGMGLDHVLRERSASLFGVLNGIDDEVWDPASDPYLPARYDADDLRGKALCKRALQQEMGLPVRDEVPLIGSIGRLVRQKGIDVIAEILPRLLQQDVQFVMLGSGEPWAAEVFPRIAAMRPDRCTVKIMYDEGLAHRIEAASDLFLMPSRFEPCGLNQMYSMRYGTLPIVRATGGLEDTVVNAHPGLDHGTGFKLWSLDEDSLYGTINWALDLYRGDPQTFDAMRRRAMRQDFSWRRAAARYESLYQLAIARRHGYAN